MREKGALKKGARFWGEVAFVAGISLYALVLGILTPGYSAGARMFPAIVLGFTGLLLALKFGALFGRGAPAAPPSAKPRENPEGRVPPGGKASVPKGRASFVIPWVLFTAAGLYLCGILPAVLVGTFVFWKVYSQKRWYVALVLSLGLTAAVQLIFVLLLHMRLYFGILF